MWFHFQGKWTGMISARCVRLFRRMARKEEGRLCAARWGYDEETDFCAFLCSADAAGAGDGQHDAGRMAAGTGRTDADSIGIRGIRGTAALMRGADGLLCVVEQCNAVPARG